jgi:hypothetical protein
MGRSLQGLEKGREDGGREYLPDHETTLSIVRMENIVASHKLTFSKVVEDLYCLKVLLSETIIDGMFEGDGYYQDESCVCSMRLERLTLMQELLERERGLATGEWGNLSYSQDELRLALDV